MEWLNELITSSSEVRQMLINIGTFIGKIIGALFLLLIGRWIARMISRGTRKLFQRLGVDKLAERLGSIDLISNANFKVVPSAIFAKIVYYIILFIFFWIAADIVQIQALSDMISKFFDYLPVLFSALVIFIAGLLLADFLKKIILSAGKSLNLPAGNLIANFVFYFMFINVAMITLSQAGIQTDAIKDNISIILGGIVAAFAIGYGFASRPLLASLLSSYYNRNKLGVGDRLTIDGEEGAIKAIESTSLTLVTNDKREIIIPLSKLLSEKYQLKKRDVIEKEQRREPPSEPPS